MIYCRICGTPYARSAGRGRPKEYCDSECRVLAARLQEVQSLLVAMRLRWVSWDEMSPVRREEAEADALRRGKRRTPHPYKALLFAQLHELGGLCNPHQFGQGR